MSAAHGGGPGERTTRTARLWIGGDGVARVILAHGCEQARADAEAVIRALESLLGEGRRRPTLFDYRFMKSMERGARAYHAGPETARVASAVAILVGSPVSRLIGTFVMGMNKPHVPTRLFTSEPDALAWLAGFVEPIAQT